MQTSCAGRSSWSRRRIMRGAGWRRNIRSRGARIFRVFNGIGDGWLPTARAARRGAADPFGRPIRGEKGVRGSDRGVPDCCVSSGRTFSCEIVGGGPLEAGSCRRRSSARICSATWCICSARARRRRCGSCSRARMFSSLACVPESGRRKRQSADGDHGGDVARSAGRFDATRRHSRDDSDGESGILVSPREPAALAAARREAAARFGSGERMGAARTGIGGGEVFHREDDGSAEASAGRALRSACAACRPRDRPIARARMVGSLFPK